MNMPEAERARRRDHVERLSERYDPEERLLKKWLSDAYSYNWYTRNAYAHPTRDSLNYAIDLLDTYDDRHIERAGHVIERIVEIQEDDPEHEHYGVWPHLMEEPLGEGPYVDRNWADFLGKDVLHALIYHKDRLPMDLVTSIEASLRRACEAIRIRNVRPGYTNIAVMGSYDTLVGGELLEDSELVQNGLHRLRDLHAFVQDNGTFTEYNSPTYTMVAMKDLATFRHHVKNPEARDLVDDLFRLSWEIVAHHFHVPTRQWSGPNSRSYNDLSASGHHRNRGMLRTIEEWTSEAVNFGLKTIPQDPEWACLDARCPEDLESFFTTIEAPREIVEVVVKRDPLDHVATTYITPNLTLGSINYQDTWNQRRNILAYWGTEDEPSCLKVRLIYDGYDLSTGAIWTQQDTHCVLGALTFATNGGGKHLSLEKLENGTFEATELALRFEFTGSATQAEVHFPGNLNDPATVSHQDVEVGIHIPYADFSGRTLRWEQIETEDMLALDVTIHRGDKRTFILPEVDSAAIGFGLQVGGNGTIDPAKAVVQSDRLSLAWKDMAFSVPTRPEPYRDLHASAEGLGV